MRDKLRCRGGMNGEKYCQHDRFNVELIGTVIYGKCVRCGILNEIARIEKSECNCADCATSIKVKVQ